MKESEFVFVFEIIRNTWGLFQCNNWSGFKNDKTKSFEKQNTDIERALTKHRYTHITFVETLIKSW